ncbi:MAG TPA: alpha/beta hydrolase [Candidatus Limnocylindrales bacterium]|nr:alpha/beta hydrolase [Candidatus Limnocylindrales bacterium]
MFLAILIALGAGFYLRPGVFVTGAQRFREWRMGLENKTVQLGPYGIHYLVGGQGKSLVLVHGLGGRAEDWLSMAPEFKSNGYKVYAIDLLGYGRSARPDVDYSISLESDILRQFLDSQNLQQADIAGWSMGGWVSLKFAADHPERVHRLILLDSAGVKFDAVNAGALRPKTPQDLNHLMEVLTPHPPHIPEFYAKDLLRDMSAHDWVIGRAMKSMYTGKDLMDGRMDAVKMPVLILWGKADVLTPPAIGEQMHQAMPQSLLQVVDGCGHLGPVNCSGRYSRSMINFLNADPPLRAGEQEFPSGQ